MLPWPVPLLQVLSFKYTHICIYLKSRDKGFPSACLLLKCLQQLGLCQAQAMEPGSLSWSPGEWQELSYWSHHLLPYCMLDRKWSQDSNPGTLMEADR